MGGKPPSGDSVVRFVLTAVGIKVDGAKEAGELSCNLDDGATESPEEGTGVGQSLVHIAFSLQ